jgi:hypothetical protein
MSRGQYKEFAYGCEAKQMAILNGLWVEEPTEALLVGQYTHCFFDNSQEKFISEHPEMFTKQKPPRLKAPYIVADKMIETIQNDELAMYCMDGKHEVIITAEMFGCLWKVMLDVENEKHNRIVDLKTTKSITERVWNDEFKCKVSFIEEYQYPLQAAIYSEVYRIHKGRTEGNWPEFLIVAVSKEKVPDKLIINMTDPDRYRYELEQIEANMPHILAVKAGEVEPKRCGHCDYCRRTKQLKGAVHYSEL